ncbi:MULTISPECIES: hypothetical protein [Methylosinus]|uniref:DNA methyltransferase n=1 Tax=Methylosinus trichosporium (strain ATCC 35070 / NCIMB 11131 / UNIQEM 75 / OB3b) TaxID=595536 RepID=A0A2D2CVM3_METT3|nr:MULTISPECIES: hypothetical protein [Methylosinus]ATQ66787.1 hypothetical protein CQW49_01915 [Methylosinus trichosporium OB3b]OBS54194.1 hypothetical protein A8B73_01950 [Methylosinus sp. 3S-1]
MSETLINLLIQLFSGAAGGAGVAKASKNLDLGPIANAIVGALGGAGGGSILTSLIPAIAGTAANGGFDIAVFAGQLVGGGVSGAIVTAIVGLIRNALVQRQRA